MKYVAAYSLLWLAGKVPTQKDVETFMKQCGVSVDKDALDTLFKKIDGKNLDEVIAAGEEKIVDMAACRVGASPAPVTTEDDGDKKDLTDTQDEKVDYNLANIWGDDDDDY